MRYVEFKEVLKSDLINYFAEGSKPTIFGSIKNFILSPGYKYTFFLRICTYLKLSKHKKIFTPLYIVFRSVLLHYQHKFGIEISPNTKVGKGLEISHFGGIVMNSKTEVGENLTIRQGVTIGVSKTGVPQIGDNVDLGAGSKIIGGIKIGNNVAVGANAVVTKDVPDNSVVAGIPAKIISSK